MHFLASPAPKLSEFLEVEEFILAKRVGQWNFTYGGLENRKHFKILVLQE